MRPDGVILAVFDAACRSNQVTRSENYPQRVAIGYHHYGLCNYIHFRTLQSCLRKWLDKKTTSVKKRYVNTNIRHKRSDFWKILNVKIYRRME